LLTGSQGEVFFPRVIAGAVTLEASAPHHNSVGDMAYVPISGEGGLNIDLKEDTFPVWVEAVDVDQGGNVLPGTNFLVHVSEPVKFSTLNITIWKEVDECLPTPTGPLSLVAGHVEHTYIVDPDIRFPLESRFVLFISTELKALDDASFILWRELEFHFNTVDLPMILVNGTLLFEGKAIEGYRVDISYFHSFTDESGNFSVSVDPDEPVFKGALEVNGSIFGYGNYKTDLELDAGSFLDSGTINLFHVPGWYEVYPAPDSEDVDPSTSVIFKFKEQILVPGEDRFSRLMSITQDGSRSPVDGNYDVSEDNRTITFKSINDLEPGKLYHVKISKDLMRWNNVSMFPLGNSTIFRVRPPVIQITVMEPSEDRDLPIDGIIRISFSHQVEKKEVEADISFSPIVQGVTFKWTSGSETMISAFFKVSTDYVLEVPSGSYGLEGETLTDDFLFSFKTSAGYENEHSIGDPQIFPSPDGGWAPGQNIRFSGIVANSTGYIITVKILKEGVTYREANSVISLEGRYSLNISAPSKEGKYTLSVSLSMPDGPLADEKTYGVQVGDAGSDSEPGDNTTRMIILAIIVLLVIAVIIVAVLYGRGQRAKAGSKTMGIEYTEVETEWEDTEDEW
ncbi:MAG: Ig-like domain-containing protein, partial [Thermoplasmatota archaeon]